MLFTHLAIVSFLTLFSGALALPIFTTRSTAAAALAAEQSTIFTAQRSQWNPAARRISEKANNAIVSIRVNTAQMRAAQALGSVDALALWVAVLSLTMAADETMRSSVQRNSIVFQMSNGKPAVLTSLQVIKDAAKEFTAAISSKMPPGFNYVGQFYGTYVDMMVANTIKEYQYPPAAFGGSSWS
ncbi:hypothetical protein E2P81_ATG03723 [Venturia nashicola]|nr:hypothetical protein E2P81_ATG03723 [Venturia nashicola]